MIIGNNIASLKKIKASEEALRAPPREITWEGIFLNVSHHYIIMTKNSTMMFYNFWVALSGALSKKTKGAHKWNIQTQA